MTAYLICSQIEDRRVGWLMALLFITLQPFLRFSYVAYSDFYLLFFLTAAFIFIKKWHELERKDFFYLSALLCGLGLNCKYNMLLVALLFYFLLLWLTYIKDENFKRSVKYTIVFFAISFVVFIPFLLKNWILTENPLYPFFINMIPTANPYQFVNVSHFLFRKFFYEESLLEILATPLLVFFYGVENNIQFFDGVLNPFFVIFPTIAVFAMKDKMITVLFIFGWLYNYFVLFLEPVSARFLLPSIPIFAYISGQYISNLNLSGKRLVVIFLPFLIFNLYYGGKHIVDKDKWLYLSGKITKEEFLERKCPDYKSIKFINENTKKDAKIFYLFSGQRTYYLERDFIYDSFNDGRLFKRVFNNAVDEEDFRLKVKKLGVTHFFIREDLFVGYLEENFNEKELEIIKKFFAKFAREIYRDRVFVVLEID